MRMSTAIRLVPCTTALIMCMTGAFAGGLETLQTAQITPDQIDQMAWSTSPTGTLQAKIVGDPAKSGMYMVRSMLPPGLRVELPRILRRLLGSNFAAHVTWC